MSSKSSAKPAAAKPAAAKPAAAKPAAVVPATPMQAMVTAITNSAVPVKPLAGKAASAAIISAALANGTAAPGATARAHTWGQHGQSVGNTGKLPAGSLVVTAKGNAYKPKDGYNALAWQAVQAAIAKGPCNATQAAQAIGHAGAAWVRYALRAGWLTTQA